MLPQLGESGQLAIMNAKVSVIGVGGLGCSVAMCLARSGVQKLQLFDPDNIELSNLQRQLLFSDADIGKSKVTAAKKELQRHNTTIEISAIQEVVSFKNLLKFQPNIIIDCCDTKSSCTVIHNYCSTYQIPLIYGRASGWLGLTATFQYDKNNAPCLYCFDADDFITNQSCQSVGVIGPLMINGGSLLATQAIRYICGLNPANEVRIDDLQNWQHATFQIPKNSNCNQCQTNQ